MILRLFKGQTWAGLVLRGEVWEDLVNIDEKETNGKYFDYSTHIGRKSGYGAGNAEIG